MDPTMNVRGESTILRTSGVPKNYSLILVDYEVIVLPYLIVNYEVIVFSYINYEVIVFLILLSINAELCFQKQQEVILILIL